MNRECCLKKNLQKIFFWYGLCWTFPPFICLYFHFRVDNAQTELKHGDGSAILFGVHCDFFFFFLSSAEIEGDGIKQEPQNLQVW